MPITHHPSDHSNKHAARRRADLGNRPPIPRSTRGQATAEYALVLLGAAAVALLLVAWAASSGLIGELFDTVVRQIISRVG